MGGYIRMDKDLVDDPRVLDLTEKLLDHWSSLGVPGVLRDGLRESACNAVTGGLYRLWRYADTHLKRHDRLHIALHGVASVTGLPVTVLRQFPQEWLIEHDDRTVELPNYSDKNTLMVKDNRREKTRERVRVWRLKQRQKEQECNALLKRESNTDERHASVTTGPGPGPDPEPISKNPLPPHSGGSRVNGTNPRSQGINPRAVAKVEGENARWKPLRDRAAACGFRNPGPHDSVETYETSLRLYERDHGVLARAAQESQQ